MKCGMYAEGVLPTNLAYYTLSICIVRGHFEHRVYERVLNNTKKLLVL